MQIMDSSTELELSSCSDGTDSDYGTTSFLDNRVSNHSLNMSLWLADTVFETCLIIAQFFFLYRLLSEANEKRFEQALITQSPRK